MERASNAMTSQIEPSHPNVTGIVAAVSTLRFDLGVPVNVIEGGRHIEIAYHSTSQDVATILDALLSQSPDYRWSLVTDRYVVYPTDPVWDRVVTAVNIKATARYDAAMQYLTVVRNQIAELSDLIGVVMKGDPRSPVFVEPVFLSPQAPIVSHLVQLLGTNGRIAFTIERALSGKRVLHFENVRA
jgi:hypothetical protein